MCDNCEVLYVNDKSIQRCVCYWTCFIINVWSLQQYTPRINIIMQKRDIDGALGVLRWVMTLFEHIDNFFYDVNIITLFILLFFELVLL